MDVIPKEASVAVANLMQTRLFIPAILLGLGLLVCVALCRDRRDSAPAASALDLLQCFGWILLTGGVLSMLFVVMGRSGLIPFFAILTVTWHVVGQYRRSQQQTMLDTLAVATEQQVPLPEALRALDDERTVIKGWDGPQLTRCLELGIDLQQALQQARTRLPRRLQVALLLQRSEAGMAAVAREMRPHEQAAWTNWASAKLAYLAGVVLLALIYSVGRYGVTIDILTEANGYAGPFQAQEWQIALSGFLRFLSGEFTQQLLTALLVFLLITSVAIVLGWIPTSWPIVRRVILPMDQARLMILFANLVDDHALTTDKLRWLAGHYPNSILRRRMARAVDRMGKGVDTWSSLAECRALPGDSAVLLQTAQRADHLPWALRKLSSAIVLRTSRRWRVLSNIGILGIVGLLAAYVLVVAAVHFLLLYRLVANAMFS